jgi:hypothetical protein
MTPTMTYTEKLVVTSCWCGIPFAIPSNLHTWLSKDSNNHCHCPNGHEMVFSNGLQQQLEEARRQARSAREREGATRSLLEHEQRSHAATRGHLTKAKKKVHRAEHGVCPHCKRTFQNLARHMESKHAEAISAGA